MSVKASIYDFFAYALPGALYLLILLHGVESFGGPAFFSNLLNSNFSNWFVFGLASYLAGFTADPLSNFVTSRLGPDKALKIRAIDSMVKRNPALKIDINPADWPYWFATIRRESLDLAYEIDRMNAQSKMMKGVSCAAMLLGLLWAVYAIAGKLDAIYLTLLPLVAAIVFLSVRQANRFKLMFFLIIFETVVSRDEPFTRKQI